MQLRLACIEPALILQVLLVYFGIVPIGHKYLCTQLYSVTFCSSFITLMCAVQFICHTSIEVFFAKRILSKVIWGLWLFFLSLWPKRTVSSFTETVISELVIIAFCKFDFCFYYLCMYYVCSILCVYMCCNYLNFYLIVNQIKFLYCFNFEFDTSVNHEIT